MLRVLGACQRIVHLHLKAERFQLADDIDDARVARIRNILLEGQAEYRDDTSSPLPPQQSPDAFFRNALAHAVVDPPAGENDFRVIAGLLGAIGQVIWVNSDAVAADESRLKGKKFHFVRAAASTSPVSISSA